MVGKQKRWLHIIPSQTSANEQQKGVTHGDQQKKNQHTGERLRKYIGKEKTVRRLFWWDELLRKQPNTHHHSKNQTEGAEGLKKAS